MLALLAAAGVPAYGQADRQNAAQAEPLIGEIKLETAVQQWEGAWCWFHPRAGAIPGGGKNGAPAVVITMQKWLLSASDYFSVLSDMRTDNLGATWEGPTERPQLGWRHIGDGVTEGICDFTPGWHAPSGKLLAFGHTVRYKNEHLMKEPRARSTSYSVYDPHTRAWAEWRTVPMPDSEKFYSAGAGCAQWITQPDGLLLIPFYFKKKSTAGTEPYAAAVMQCRFDADKVEYVRHGNELRLDVPRGFCEPSITFTGGRYYITLRNDVKGYVAASDDGLHYSEPKPWFFDDGRELGSYNTQQHWATHSGGLFLVYTRRGAHNDHIVRNRAPLFIARVDTDRLCVIRSTERVLVPERGAMLGNFGVATINQHETWVTVGEGMYKDAAKRGANGSVFVARILWAEPNRLAFPENGRRIP